MKRRLLCLLLCFSILVSAVPLPVFAMEENNSHTFKDVTQNDWFYDSVKYAVENNIFSGTDKDTFSPNDPMTRAMYVTVMGHIAGISDEYSIKEGLFSDVKHNAYYAPYVMWAVEKGISKGVGNNKFSPNSLITREQMATLTVNFFDAYGIPYPESTNKAVPKDLDKISDYAKSAVMKLWSCGLLMGDEKGNFNPKKNATRAEAAAFTKGVNKTVASFRDNTTTPKPDTTPKPKPDTKPKQPDSKPKPNENTGGSKDSGGPVQYFYNITYVTNGGNEIATQRLPSGSSLRDLPIPFKQNEIFSGWYYDAKLENRVLNSDALRQDITLYAKYGDIAPLAEAQTPSFASALDQGTDFAITVVSSKFMTADQVKDAITAKNLSSLDQSDFIKVTGEGTTFTISGKEGFEEGGTYKITLEDEALNYQGLDTSVRDYNFTISKKDVMNLTLNKDMSYIPFNEVSNITQNGQSVKSLSTPLVTVGSNSKSVLSDLTEGTFTYSGNLKVGDNVTIYEGIRPDQRVLDDTRTGADGAIAYLTITAVNGNTYSYKSAEVEDVLFEPDVLPVPNTADTDGNPANNSITVNEDVMEFSDDIYSPMELDSQTTVDVGDYLAFYEGKFSANSNVTKYGCITSVSKENGIMVITYTDATIDQIISSMDMYNTDPLDGETLLENVDVAALESSVEQQARDSGFAEEAAMYLSELALKTDSFTKLSDDIKLNDFQVSSKDGTPLNTEELQLMAGDSKVEVELNKLQANISTKLKHFDTSGVRLTLDVGVEIKIEVNDDTEIVINVTGSFEEEVHISINIDGGAKWKWWGIFPYISEYEVTTNIDLFNFTGIGINASIVTKEKVDNKWTENKELQKITDELKKLLDEKEKYIGDGEGTVADGLTDKYKAMLETESDWVNLFEKEIYSYEYRIPPIFILVVEFSVKFAVTANMNISIGCDFYYENAKRYSYTVQVFEKNVTSDVIDIREEHYEFTFYVMGTIGIRAGIKAEIKVGLISTKLASVGFSAEAGVYVRLWGYFYYKLEYTASKGRSSSYAGALYFELGIYLEIKFEAQAFAGTFSYNPTLYENEWPLWSAGMRENVQDFGYEETSEFTLKKHIRKLTVPDEVFNMSYMDMKTGDDEEKIFDDAKYFTIELTNKAFSYDPVTNILSITPDEGDFIEEGEMIITWAGAPLAFTSAPITRTFNVYWDNLNNGYAIIFNTNGGSTVPMIINRYNAPVTAPAEPSKVGYNFAGWYTDSTFSTPYVIPATMPNVDTVVYAKWIPRDDTPYTVEHYQQNLNNNLYTRVDSDTQRLYGTTDSSVTPEPKAYVGFNTTKSQNLTVMPDGSGVLKYYYSRGSYTVTFDPGQAGGEPTVYKYKYGKTLTAPQINMTGYTFIAWDKVVPEFMPAENMTFVAQWRPVEDTAYRLEHYIQMTNGEGYTLSQIEQKSGKTNAELKVQNFVRALEGITFEKATVDGLVTQSTQIKGNGTLVVKLYYTRNKHNVSFVVENGSTTEKTYRYGEIVDPPITPAKEGYTFSGWKTNSYMQEEFVFGKPMPNMDLTVYGALKPNNGTKYIVEHYYQKTTGVGYNLNMSEQKTGTTDEKLNLAGFAVTVEGVTFEKATVDGLVTQNTQIKGDGTLVVKLYYTRNKYTLSFVVENGNNIEKVYHYGAIVEQPATPSKAGYTFSGWKTNKELTEEFVFGKAMPAKNITVYGAITPNSNTKYIVEHYYQNTTGKGYNLILSEQKTGTTDVTLNLADSAMTVEGITFEKATVDGQVTQTTQIKGSGALVVKLYYTRNKHTVSFLVENGNNIEKVYHYGEIVEQPTNPSKDGYTFSGWKTNKELTEEFVFGKAMPAKNITVYGAITPNSNTKYIVEHYYQNTTGEGYNLTLSEQKTGTTDVTLNLADLAMTVEGITFEKATVDGQVTQTTQIKGSGALVVKLYYTRNKHTVSFLVENGNNIEKVYHYGEIVEQPTNPSKDGYTFSGWKTNKELTEEFVFGKAMPAKNITVYGAITPNSNTKYRVEHYQQNTAGGGYTLINADNLLGITDTETKASAKTFTGFTAKEFKQASISGDGRTVIRIDYDRNVYNVELDMAGGTIHSGNVKKYIYGVGTQLPTDITRAGYVFSGWFDELSRATNISTSDTGDKRYIAKWSPISNTVYTVKHLREDLNGKYTIEEVEGKNGATDTDTAASARDYTGFTACSFNQSKISGDGSTVIEILYNRNSYNLSWNLIKGSLEGNYTNGPVKFGTPITQPNMKRDGYTFSGWFSNSGLENKYNIPAYMPAEDISVYGSLTANSGISYKIMHYCQNADDNGYTLYETDTLTGSTDDEVVGLERNYEYFYFNGNAPETLLSGKIKADGSLVLRLYYDRETFTVGYMVDDEPYGEQAVYKYGQTVAYPTVPQKEGYLFDTWLLDGGSFTGSMPGRDITLAASWSAGEKSYTVRYYLEKINFNNEAERWELMPENSTVKSGTFDETVTVVPENEYVGFSTPAEQVVTLNSNLSTVDFKYTRNSYRLTWNLNGGTPTNDYTTSLEVKYNTPIVAPILTMTGNYYVWDKEIAVTMPDADMEYTANWTANTYTVGFSEQGFENITVTYGDSYGDLPEVSKIGYTFDGWFTAASGGEKIEYSSKVAIPKDHVLYAHWSVNSYTLDWNLNGGTASNSYTSGNVAYGTSLIAPAPVKTGYDFAGWDKEISTTMPTENLTYNANWTPKTYTVQFNETGYNSITVTYGETYGALPVPSKAGYIFDGWYTNAVDGDRISEDSVVKIIADQIIYAHWKAEVYKLIWDLSGGTAQGDYTYGNVPYGASLIAPVPSKTGYEFTGWDKEIAKTMPAENLTYTANWTPKTYTVQFNESGYKSITVTYGETYGALPVPSKAGYIFDGWYTNAVDGDRISEDSVVEIIADQIIYAHWKVEVYKLIWDLSGGTAQGEYTNGNVPYGASLIAPVPSKTGYEFTGWNKEIAKTMPAENLTYTANWTPKTYTVQFNEQGDKSITVTYGETYGALPVPSKTGYIFEGWFTNAINGERINEDTVVKIISDQMLYAHWKVEVYKLIWDLSGGTAQGEYTNGNVPYGASLIAPVPSKTGYEFTGWDKEIAQTMPAENLTYTANWTPKSFTVTLNANGGIINSGNISEYTYGVGTILPVDVMRQGYTFEGWYDGETRADRILETDLGDKNYIAKWSVNTYSITYHNMDGAVNHENNADLYTYGVGLTFGSPVKTGYDFIGWFADVDFKNQKSSISASDMENVDLYAKWVPKIYNVILATDGGTLSSGSDITSYTFGTTVVLPTSDKIKKAGYIFTGWTDGTKIVTDIPLNSIGDKSYTATWEIVGYDISYELYDGVNSADNPHGYNVLSGNIYLADPVKEGYVFEGWFIDQNFITHIGSPAIEGGSTGSVTFYAKWRPSSYTVVFNANEGTGSMLSQSYNVYEEKALSLNAFTREGYSFAGWATSVDGSTAYINEAKVVNLSQTDGAVVNLYAVWSIIDYTITYNLNSGTNNAANPEIYTVKSQGINLGDPTRAGGYVFEGWYDNENFTGNKVTQIEAGATGNLTLYALWKHYGVFSVSVGTNNTFTITRTDGFDGTQKVYYRTQNGSAIGGGTHFSHVNDYVTFNQGETSKTISVFEYSVSNPSASKVATRYSNADRVYFLDIYKVEGGGKLGGTTRATRTMTKDSAYTVDSNALNVYKLLASVSNLDKKIYEDAGGSYKGTVYTGLSSPVFVDDSKYSPSLRTYIRDTASAMKIKLSGFTGKDDGWRMYRFVLFNNQAQNATFSGSKETTIPDLPSITKCALVYGITADTDNTDNYSVNLPAYKGSLSATGTSKPVSVSDIKWASGQDGGDYVLYGFDETCGISVGAYNSATANSMWHFNSASLYALPKDVKEPTLLDVAPMANATFNDGDKVIISLIFDEIVNSADNVSINTMLSNDSFTLKGGIGTNILYFEGTVSGNGGTAPTKESILINNNDNIKDMCN